MAAIATKKILGDMGVAVTFPSNFQKFFVGGISYYPSDLGTSIEVMAGNDFQSQWHEQKRLDANQSVMNGLQARKSAERKLLTGPHNYHLPKPVLGQRRYANPSMGAESSTSARRDNGGQYAPWRVIENSSEVRGSGGLVGGVVHTMEGQIFYKKQLEDRINQLNRIDAVAQGYSVNMGQSETTFDNTKEGGTDKVTFFLYLRTLMDAITVGDLSKFSFENLKDLMKMLFQYSPKATTEDFRDIISAADDILESLRDGLSEEPDAAMPITYRAYADTLLLFVKAIRSYTTEMNRNMFLSVPDKITLSRSLVKSLGFESLLMKSTPMEVVGTERKIDPRLNQSADNYDDGPNDGEFDVPNVTREDNDQFNAPRAPLAGDNGDPNRSIFGKTTGAVVRGNSSWFGESTPDETPAFVSPLSSSGPSAILPPVDPNTFGIAVEDAIKHSLETVTDTLVTPDNESALIDANYPDKNVLVAEIDLNLTDKGYSKAEIASGMSINGNPMFGSYISANSGEIGPAAIEPAYTASISPHLPPSFYQPPSGPTAEAGPSMAPALALAPKKSKGVSSALQHGMPNTREKLKEDYTTITQLKTLWSRLPKEWTGDAKSPNGNMLVKNAQSKIIKLIAQHVPDF